MQSENPFRLAKMFFRQRVKLDFCSTWRVIKFFHRLLQGESELRMIKIDVNLSLIHIKSLTIKSSLWSNFKSQIFTQGQFDKEIHLISLNSFQNLASPGL